MSQESSKPRPAVVTLAMLGLLLLTVGAAWLVVRYHRSPSRQGALIIEEMRRQRLSRLWPAEPYSAWFIQRDSAGRVESRLGVRRQPADGGFEGMNVHRAAAGRALRMGDINERWTVSDDLTSGHYRADYISRRYHVDIRLEGRLVTFTGPDMDEVTTDAPANYLPEGLERLAVRMVAAEGRKAVFAFIDNDASVANKTIVFVNAVMAPAGPQAVRCLYQRGGSRPISWTYHLGAGGEVARIEWEDRTVLAPATAPAEEAPDESDDFGPL